MSGRVPADPVAVYLVMIGPPAAGKGRQAERVARERGLLKISTGDMLREAIQQRSDLGRRAKAIVERGDLVSDEVMIGVVRGAAGGGAAVRRGRVGVYVRQTEPIVGYYERRPTFRKIDGAQSPDGV